MATIATMPAEDATDFSNVRRDVALCFLAVAYILYAWAWNTVDVLRPYIAKDLGLTLTEAGSLYSIQAVGALVGAVVNGQLADRFGRRRALMVVMVGYGLLLVSGAFVQSYAQVMLQRGVMGYFMGSMYPITVGLYTGLFSKGARGRVASVIVGSSWAAVSLLGFVSAAVFEAGLDWHVLLWVGAIPVVLSLFAPLAVPDDRRMIPVGGHATTKSVAGKLPIGELFVPEYRRQTLMLTLLAGLNFFAYQAFTGWATTWLKDDRGFSAADIGAIVGWTALASIFGGFFWGWIGDRYGRRAPATGFLIAAALILVYLFAPLDVVGLQVVAFLYCAALACSTVWGPWLAELYPQHLRSTPASIFNWGWLVSFAAPLVTGQLAENFGLALTMSTASLTFAVAALIWLRLPETLER